VIIPDSVTSIGNNAFYSCKSLKTVTYLGMYYPGSMPGDVFKECSDDLEICVTESYPSDKFCGRSVYDSCTLPRGFCGTALNAAKDLL